MKDKRRSTNT